MDNQKVVVVLLLITIILSVVTVVLTVGINIPDLAAKKTSTNLANPEDVYSVQAGGAVLNLEPPKGNG